MTNYFQCNYWGKKGASRAVLARELSLDEIINIKENANVEIEVQVHGMTCMFQSKRMLLGNYYTFQDRQMKIQRNESQKDYYYMMKNATINILYSRIIMVRTLCLQMIYA